MGNYTEAIRIRNLALNLAKTVYGEDSIDYASLLSDLASDYSRIDNDTAAIRLEAKAMEIQKENYGETSSEYAKCLSNLAKYYCRAAYLGHGDYYPEAIELQKSAVEIYKNNAEDDKAKDTSRLLGSLYGFSLMSLAEIYYMIGNYSEAVKYQNLGIEYEKEYRGEDLPHCYNAWHDLADYYLADGQYDKGNDLYNKVYFWYISEFSSDFSGLSGDERAMRWVQSNSYGQFFSEHIPCVAYKCSSVNDTTLAGIAYNSIVLSKGFLLNSEFEMLNVIEQKGNSVIKERYYKMNRDRVTLDSLMQISADKRSIDADSLSKAIKHEEHELAGLAWQLGDYIGNLAIDWTEIQKKLKDGDMAVEFANFRDDREKKMYYAAFVLKKGMESPVCVPLFEFEDFKDIKTTDYYKTPKLYNHIWKPIEKHLQGVKSVYFSPAGRLHTIAIESLPDANGKIFSEKYDAYRLSSTRELVVQRTANLKKKAATYGGIKYDFTEEDWLGVKLVENDTIIGFHDTPLLAETQRGGGMAYLDGTLIESTAVANLLRSVDYDVDALSDAAATEESFKRLSGTGLKILHIGTHGFYQSEVDMENAGLKFFTDAKQQTQEDRSLSCSGLLFAGANSALDPSRAKEIPEGADDGVLTAKEISRLDFRGLELVVLSACQTGLGEITGEGVFGLQRGFKKAGAQTIVMSLWKVSDESTQLLMIEFFKNLTAGQSKRAAFTAAQKTVRQKYPNPLHWAAFVMVDGI
ncbi:MAG: CHAT domain-containing protein [Bacteroidales bacterium]|nr:CHAT domain-containing protein [Bacteroidales bacterium]